MLTLSYDPVRAVGLWLFSGTSNSDADYERYLASLRDRDLFAKERDSVAIVVVDKDNPPPDARWRRRIAEATSSFRSRPVAAFVLPSLPQRAIVTAINWLRPPPYEFTVHATFDALVEHLSARRPDLPTKLYRELLAEARASAARGSTSMRAVGADGP